ncbi:MAG: hypothetical protein NWQ46_04175 [Spirosomaceae bacterium]|nr:hypothetical protein [Spirosomataceae bacterium]
MQINPLQFLSKQDVALAQVISEITLPEIESTQDVFHDLMSCVLEQQIHYRSTKKIFQKMLEAAEIEMLTPQNFGDFEEKAFEKYKLSANKYETVLQVLEFWENNEIDWQKLTDDEVREQLGSIKGVGNWTMDMILLYTLNRPDIVPLDDFHLKEIMTTVYGLNPKVKLKAAMREVSEKWGEYKSTAVLYLLAWKAFNKRR